MFYEPTEAPPHVAKLVTLGLVILVGGLMGMAALLRGTFGASWTPSGVAAPWHSGDVASTSTGSQGGGDDGLSTAGAIDPQASPRSGQTARSTLHLLSDAEFVYGPPDQNLDIDRLVQASGGALARYRGVGPSPGVGAVQAGADLLRQVSRDHSISPRLLVALLDLEDAGVSGQAPDPWSGGGVRLAGAGLDGRLAAMAASLARGYYGFKYRGLAKVALSNRQEIVGPGDTNAATFAVARYLAGASATTQDWQRRQAEFLTAYETVAGDRFDSSAGVPAQGLQQPPLLLPWPQGETWSFTGGPHGSWGIDSAWGAVDFAPPSRVGCAAAPEWVVAAAPGRVVRSETGHVAVDLDGDGYEGTGWVVSYFHMADQGRVALGTTLAAGDRVGHPSCVGGKATGAHIHFMRRYNGEWLPAAGGPAPLDLSGWTFQSFGAEYDGAMRNPAEGQRFAATSRVNGPMEVQSDNGPERRLALADAWASFGAGSTVPSSTTRLASAAPVDPSPEHEAGQVPADQVGGNARVAGSRSGEGPAIAALVGGPDAPSLGITLTLAGRTHHETPFILGLAQGGPAVAVLMGHSAASGEADALAMPPAFEPGVYTITVRAPGFLPGRVVNVPLGHGHVQVDLSAGGSTPLVPGELTGDDQISTADAWAWFDAWRQGQRLADVNGDGGVGFGDLRLVLANRGGR